MMSAPAKGKTVGWWYGRPYVLAKLDAELHAVVGLEDVVSGKDCHLIACVTYFYWLCHVIARDKPALLIELGIVGQESLGNNAKDSTMLTYYGTIIESGTDTYRYADDGNDIQLTRHVKQMKDCILCSFHKTLLSEEILACVTRNRKFGEHHYLHTLFVSLSYKFLYLLDIVIYVSNPYRRNCRGNRDETVIHKNQFCF